MQARLHEHYDINLLAVSRAGRRITQRLRSTKLRAGDVIVLQGNLAAACRRRSARCGCCRSPSATVAMGRAAQDLLPLIDSQPRPCVLVAIGIAASRDRRSSARR